jgi:malate permease and related proteins
VLVVVVATFFTCWLVGSRVPVAPGVLAVINHYVITVALPALIIATMTQVDIGAETVTPAVLAWASMAVSAVIVMSLGRIMKWPRQTVGALMMVAVLGNTSFLGIGVVRALLGESHVAAAISYDQLGTFLALATYGSWTASRYGNADDAVSGIIRRLVTFPPFLALAASFVLRAVSLPDAFLDVLSAVGKTVAPVAMGALGLRFKVKVSRNAMAPSLWGLGVKMLIVPTCVTLVAIALGHRADVVWAASAMQSAAPPMVTAGIVAVNAGLDDEVVSFMVGIGTLISFAMLPLVSLAF